VFGKRIGGDIICNKKTFLLINAFQLADSRQLDQLNHWTQLTTFNEQEKIAAVTEIYNELNIKELTAEKINHYFTEAQHTLSSINLPVEGKQSLQEFALSLINRSY
jgi:geranylgeranyl diphosphate synthase type II